MRESESWHVCLDCWTICLDFCPTIKIRLNCVTFELLHCMGIILTSFWPLDLAYFFDLTTRPASILTSATNGCTVGIGVTTSELASSGKGSMQQVVKGQR